MASATSVTWNSSKHRTVASCLGGRAGGKDGVAGGYMTMRRIKSYGFIWKHFLFNVTLWSANSIPDRHATKGPSEGEPRLRERRHYA